MAAIGVGFFAGALRERRHVEDIDFFRLVQADVDAFAEGASAADVDGPGAFGLAVLLLRCEGETEGRGLQTQVLQGRLARGAGLERLAVLAFQTGAQEPIHLVAVGCLLDGLREAPLAVRPGEGDLGLQFPVGVFQERGAGDVRGGDVLDEVEGLGRLRRFGRLARQTVAEDVNGDGDGEHGQGEDERGRVTHRVTSDGRGRR